MSGHLSDWTLLRLHAGELDGPEEQRARAHTAECTRCRAGLRTAEEAQRRFESEISFERFAAGVERAAREPVASRGAARRTGPALALAASVALAVLLGPHLVPSRGPLNRTKGGATVELRAGGAGGQRLLAPGAPEPLSPGERVRIGYAGRGARHLVAVSVDGAGEVSALYPEAGASEALEPGADVHYLPGSIEFTGSGAERVIVVTSERPLSLEAVRRAARRAFDAASGQLDAMPPLEVSGEQTHWVLVKP